MKPRIYLEKLMQQDFESFYALTGNEKVMAMITERALTKEEALKKFNYFLQNNIASRKILLKNGFVSEEVGEIDGLPSEIFGRKL